MIDDAAMDGYTYSMCNEMKITLPMRKEYRILACNRAIAYARLSYGSL